MVKFLRRTWKRYSKLGRKRKKKQVWRRPTGRDNKMREKIKGHPPIVEIGYKKDKKLRGTIKNKYPKVIKNIKELDKVGKNHIVIVGNIGKKKKIEIVKRAKEKKIKIHNINIKKFLKDLEKIKVKEEVKKVEKKKWISQRKNH